MAALEERGSDEAAVITPRGGPVVLDVPVSACRAGCAACCIVISISSAIPGLPGGKPAGVRCPQLSDSNLCLLFNLPSRPAICRSLKASMEMCGQTAQHAFTHLAALEEATRPDILRDGTYMV